jgi:hypothetical protein
MVELKEGCNHMTWYVSPKLILSIDLANIAKSLYG